MAHSYRALHHWNNWITQEPLGSRLIDLESQLLSHMLKEHFGKFALLIGVPQQRNLLTSTVLPCQALLTPLISKGSSKNYIESELNELPILTGSMDLVMLPHTLDFVDNPRQLLTEACRIIKPEGLIVICGFNPYSLWGLSKYFNKEKKSPWTNRFIHAYDVKKWLHLADFQLEQQKYLFFRPPVRNTKLFQKLSFLDWIGSRFFPFFGGVYILFARAKVIPLTPIRLHWKQQLSDIRISTTISGHIARQSKFK